MLELRKLNDTDVISQWEYVAALPADENGFANPHEGISLEDYRKRVLPEKMTPITFCRSKSEAQFMNQYDNPAFFEEYSKMSRSQYGLDGAGEWHQLAPLFPELSGKVVLDLGCGYGWHCKYAADRGAVSVLGIDQSKRMIEEAKCGNSADCIEYQVCDLLDFPYPEQTYDLVVSNLVLHYLEDLDTVYACIYQTLQSGGVFLFNIEHPTFTAGVKQQFAPDGTWPVADYYYPGERITDFLGYEVKKYHHTLTQILNGLLKAGFVIEAVEEAMPPDQWRDQMPEEMTRPIMLLVKARKQ